MLDSMLINAFSGGFGYTLDISNADVMSQYSIAHVDRGVGLAVICAFIVGLRFLFYYRLVTAFTGGRKG